MASDKLTLEGFIGSGFRKVLINGTIKFRGFTWKDSLFQPGETLYCTFVGKYPLDDGPIEFRDQTHRRICTIEKPEPQELKLLLQPKGSKVCGQTCVAMFLGTTIEHAIQLVGKKGRTQTKDLVKPLRQVFQTKDRLTKVKSTEELPSKALLRIKWNAKGSHWVLINDGTIYDPAYGCSSLSDYLVIIHGRITSFLELKHLQ